MDVSAKEFLEKVIADYNAMFKTSFSLESKSFENYYRDLSNRMKNQEVDLMIVVGMFLTGFDAPMLNTLFVDKTCAITDFCRLILALIASTTALKVLAILLLFAI